MTAASYFGGSGDDELRGVAIGSDGSIFVSGNSSSSELAALVTTPLAMGEGFVAKLDGSGSKVLWLSRVPAGGSLKLTAQDEPILITGQKLTKLSADGTSISWTGADVGAAIDAFDIAPQGDIALIAGNDVFSFASDGITQKFRGKTGRSHAVGVAIDPKSGEVLASGDQNAGYGTCGGPWRSPFIFRYDATGKQTAKLYDYPGQAACDEQLAADSFFTHLRFEPNGELWVTGGSDGGNTVLSRTAGDLSKNSTALAGACFDSACYGWKGAAAPRFVARVNSAFSDFERATFIVAHFNKQPKGCTCDVPQDDGSGARPNSAGLDFVFRTSTGDVVGAGSAGWHFPVVDAWYPAAAYTPGYPAVVSVLDGELKTMKMATLLPGTGSTQAADYRGGRLVVVGSAPDNSTWVAPAGQEQQAQAVLEPLPAGAPLQAKYGGGKSDGFIYVACVTTDAECGAAPRPTGGSGGAGSTAGAGTTDTAGTTNSGTGTSGGGDGASAAGTSNSGIAGNVAGNAATSGDSGGCGCAVATPTRARSSIAALALLGSLGRRRKRTSARTRARSFARKRI
ncbi:MAG TPA: MYXO-CTERM sorting domain-containing protein [Polyangiaceae bacterium]|nr:MYXO-CTERM sorting domain-containing protein [Polyangiaceae bacterium]